MSKRDSVGPGRKNKELPKNLEWKNKSIDIFMTSLKQKFDSKGQKQPQEFIDLKQKMDSLRTLFKTLVEKESVVSRSISNYSKACLTNRDSLKEFSAKLPQDDVLSPALLRFSEVEEEISSFCEAFREYSSTVFIKEIEKYQNNEIQEFNDAKKVWKKALLEYNATKSKLNTILHKRSEQIEAIRLFIAQVHNIQAMKNESIKLETVYDKATDALWIRDYEILKSVVQYIQNYYEFILQSYNSLYQLEEYIEQLKQYAVERRKDWNEFVVKRKQERKQIEEEEYANRYNPLVELLSAPDLALVNAICVSSGSDKEVVLESLINILDAHKMTLKIIKLGITVEVEKTKDAGTLFRGNTMATKLMTAFTRMYGRSYITSTLKPVLDILLKDVENGKRYEIDPSKAPNENLKENLENLKSITLKFFDSIVNSIDQCPIPFRIMASHLKEEVVKIYPDARYSSIGGFIFLRFFCPAILSPESASPPLLTTVPSSIRRVLVLISKILQNLASGVKFGSKESYLTELNTFIDENDEKCKKFLHEISTAPNNEDYETLCTLEVAKNVELPNLHRTIVKNLSKIGQTLTQYKNEDTIPILASILAELGDSDLNITPEKKKGKSK